MIYVIGYGKKYRETCFHCICIRCECKFYYETSDIEYYRCNNMGIPLYEQYVICPQCRKHNTHKEIRGNYDTRV